MDFIAQFIDKMRAAGCGPAHPDTITADDKKYRYQVEDEKGGKKSGRYQLKVDGSFAVGWFLDFRQGQTHRFSAYTGRKSENTPEQWEQLKVAREAAMKKQLDQRRDDHAKAAKKALAIWEKSDIDGSTEYVEKKGAALNGARIWRKNIVAVPVWISDRLASLQFISHTGEKRFLTGSELVGGYFGIASVTGGREKIFLVEGFATGDAAHRATGAATVIAFNAGNLKAVAIVLRKKYPDAHLVIAADNDRWTMRPDKKTPWNPGVEFAIEAAKAVGNATVAVAHFAKKDLVGKPTDWNDALLLYGIEYVRNGIGAAAQPEEVRVDYAGGAPEYSLRNTVQTDVPSSTQGDDGEYGHLSPEPPVDIYHEQLPSIRELGDDEHWQGMVIRTAKGDPKSTSLQNTILFLKFHDAFKGIFAYNLFHHNLMIVRCPPWERQEDFHARRLDDVAITNCAAELEKYGLNLGTDKVFKAIQSTSMEVQFHPARQYFNSLRWDGTARLATWLQYYMGCENEHPDYLAFVGTKWLIAAVRRVFHPGCKFDQVLVIEGEQGVGKSTALRYLATFGREKEETYFTDGLNLSQIENKDTVMKLQGSIIIELAELSGFSKKEDDAIKAWIGLNDDDARLPYAKEVTKFGRQFVLAATTNRTDYLKDPTGNRRYWPIYSQAIDLKSIKQDREQLWAEAVHLYNDGMDITPTIEEGKLAKIECAKRLSQDSWNDTVMRHIRELLDRRGLLMNKGFKVNEVMDEMGMAMRDRDDRSARRITGILQINGFENKSQWNPDTQRTERLWVVKAGEQ